MSHQLHRPAGSSGEGGDLVTVTPQVAGWRYCGLRVLELAAGEQVRVSTGTAEMAAVPLAGSFSLHCQDRWWDLTGRTDCFSGPSDFLYLPIGTEVTITSPAGGRLALPAAEATRRLPVRYGPASEVPVEIRGAGQSTRQVNNFLEPSAFPADKLVAVEVITPAGNWSSYPPHKHDEQGPTEAILEEIYYFELAKVTAGHRQVGEGFALQRVYSADGEIDLCEEVRHGDVVLIPRGYHGPSVAPPGYDLYYLNVLGGPGEERTMAFCDDPAYHWIRQSWESELPDPRLKSRGALP